MSLLRKSALSLLIGLALPATASAMDLLQVYQLAEKHDATYQAAKYTYEAQKLNTNIAFGALLPLLEVTGNQTYTHSSTNSPANYNSNDFNVSATQIVFDFTAWKTYTQAEASVKQAAIAYAQAGENLILRTAKHYFDVLQAEDKLRYAVKNEEQTKEQMSQAEQKYRVGLAAQTDVLTAKASYEAAVATRIASANNVDDALEALAVITGQRITDLAKLKADFPLVTPDPKNPKAWVSTALQNNLALMASNAQAKFDQEGIQVARGAWFPTVNVSGTYDSANTSATGVTVNTASQSAAINLDYTLFTGGNTYYTVKQAKLTYDSDKYNVQQTEREVTSKIRQSYLTVFSDVSQVKALKQAVISGESSLEAARAAYLVGTRTIVDLLLEQSNLFSTQQQYADATYSYVTDSLTMKQVAGLLSVRDITAVNKWLEPAKRSAKPTTPKSS